MRILTQTSLPQIYWHKHAAVNLKILMRIGRVIGHLESLDMRRNPDNKFFIMINEQEL